MTRSMILLAVPLLAASAQTAENPKERPVALERKLLGEWKGAAACQGNLTFRADGTLGLRHYSPGDNKLDGAWELRWDALPPTLVLTWKSSDEPDQASVGRTWKVRLLELNDEALVYQLPGAGRMESTRVKK